MTDFAEMVLMQSPNHHNPFPQNPLPGQIQPSSSPQAYQSLLGNAHLIQEGLQIALLAKQTPPIARQTAADVTAQASSLSTILAGPNYHHQSAGYLHDSNSARVTNAHTLWPGGAAPFEDATGASPLPPGDSLPMIGIWDEGGVSPSGNPGLVGRLFEGNTTSELQSEFRSLNATHTVGVANVLALQDQGDGLQGLAWESRLKIFSDRDDFREMAAEAIHDPGTGKTGMSFSNHSYSPGAAWEYDSGSETHQWWGPLTAGPNDEDPEFGAYTLRTRLIDSVTYHSQTYLPVFTSGNAANGGAPVRLGDPGYSYTAVQITPDPKDPLLEIRTEFPNQTATHPGNAGPPVSGAPTPEDVNPPFEQDLPSIGTGIGLGLDTVKSTGVAKNNLTVGAIYTGQDGTDLVAETIGLSHFSSRGPIDDGRVKPDIMAASTFEPLPPSAINWGGTSSAAPAIVGILALLQEINADRNGPRFLASTWKALILNTTIDATDLSFLKEQLITGSSTEYELVRVTSHLGIAPQIPGAIDNPPLLIGPDYFFGWGLADAQAAAQLLVKNLRSQSGAAHLCEHTLFDTSNDTDDSNNLTVEIPFEHDGEATEIRAMLC